MQDPFRTVTHRQGHSVSFESVAFLQLIVHLEHPISRLERDHGAVGKFEAAFVPKSDFGLVVAKIFLWREQVYLEIWAKDDRADNLMSLAVGVAYHEFCRAAGFCVCLAGAGADFDIHRFVLFRVDE